MNQNNKKILEIICPILSSLPPEDVVEILSEMEKILSKNEKIAKILKAKREKDFLNKTENNEIKVILAKESEKDREIITKLLIENFGDNLKIVFSVDEKIDGGFILQRGNNLVDYSFGSQMNKLKSFLNK